MLADTIAVGVIAAGAAIGSQFVTAWGKSQSDRYIKKIDYLQSAQEKLLELVGHQFTSLASFDVDEIIERCAAAHNTTELAPLILEFSAEYKAFMPMFFKYRHNLPHAIRKKCDVYYLNMQTILIEIQEFRQIARLEAQTQRNLIISFYTLTSLVFVGVLKALESISDQVTK